MNRRLFVRHLATGLALPLLPAVPSAAFGATPADQPRRESTARLTQQLGTLQHVTVSHVYSPERTSLAALKAIVLADMATVNQLLGTDFTLTEQVWTNLSAAEYGSYSTQFEHNNVTMTWQGLARIGSEASQATTRLVICGSNGTLQASPVSKGYQLIDWQGRAVALRTSSNTALNQLPRRDFISV